MTSGKEYLYFILEQLSNYDERIYPLLSKTIMMENVLSFSRAAAPWISMGLLIAFLCVRPTIRKSKAGDDYAEEGMCVGMCLGMALGSLSDSSNSGLGTSLGMLIGLAIGLCMHKKGNGGRGDEK